MAGNSSINVSRLVHFKMISDARKHICYSRKLSPKTSHSVNQTALIQCFFSFSSRKEPQNLSIVDFRYDIEQKGAVLSRRIV